MEYDIISIIVAGLLATLFMDLTGHTLSLARIYKAPSNPAMLGRWAFYTFRGQFRHENLAEKDVVKNEASIGFLLHYLIGIMLAFFYVLVIGTGLIGHSLAVAAGYGLATNVFPWFWLFPSLGFGFFGLKGDRLLLSSTINHLVYGICLYLFLE